MLGNFYWYLKHFKRPWSMGFSSFSSNKLLSPLRDSILFEKKEEGYENVSRTRVTTTATACRSFMISPLEPIHNCYHDLTYIELMKQGASPASIILPVILISLFIRAEFEPNLHIQADSWVLCVD